MISTYEKLVDEIVLRLKGTVEEPAFDASKVFVEKSPATIAAYDKLDPKWKGRILVSFLQDRYGTDENDTAMLVGESTMNRIIYFSLSIESRQRYGDTGALVLLEKANELLLGYKSDTIGGELYAFAVSMQEYEGNIWSYRVIVRWKDLPLQGTDSFRLLGDEDLVDGTPYYVTQVTFTPEQINVLDGNTPGYLDYLTDDKGNRILLPEGYVLVKKY